jgi:hypothetical protein
MWKRVVTVKVWETPKQIMTPSSLR